MTTFANLIRRGAYWPYRRLEMKRPLSDGDGYETSWQDISRWVISWGSVGQDAGDNIIYGSIELTENTVILWNGERKFGPSDDGKSDFNGYQGRFRTKFKFSWGCYDDDFTLREAGTAFYILFSDPIDQGDGTIAVSLAPMMQVFRNEASSGITISGDESTDTLVDRLLTKEDADGTRLFDRYFEGADDSTRYQTTAGNETVELLTVDQESVWDTIAKLALLENYIFYINKDGNFVWGPRNESASSEFTFNGGWNTDETYGVHIAQIASYGPALDRVYQRVVVEYADNTYAEDSQEFTKGDKSSSDKYGQRTFNVVNHDLSQAQAESVATRLKLSQTNPKDRIVFKTDFVSHLALLDKVTVNFQGETEFAEAGILGWTRPQDLLDPGGTPTGFILSDHLFNINIVNKNFKIMGQMINLDELNVDYILEEV